MSLMHVNLGGSKKKKKKKGKEHTIIPLKPDEIHQGETGALPGLFAH